MRKSVHPLLRRQGNIAGKVVQVGDELLEDELLPVTGGKGKQGEGGARE